MDNGKDHSRGIAGLFADYESAREAWIANHQVEKAEKRETRNSEIIDERYERACDNLGNAIRRALCSGMLTLRFNGGGEVIATRVLSYSRRGDQTYDLGVMSELDSGSREFFFNFTTLKGIEYTSS